MCMCSMCDGGGVCDGGVCVLTPSQDKVTLIINWLSPMADTGILAGHVRHLLFFCPHF